MDKQQRMKNIVKRMQDYIGTYDKQRAYEDYDDDTFILDLLYGIGIAIDPDDYQYAQGFDKFKEEHLQRLCKTTNIARPANQLVDKDVHTEHCCGEHSICKYGKEDDGCTVCSGEKKASYTCNCEHM